MSKLQEILKYIKAQFSKRKKSKKIVLNLYKFLICCSLGKPPGFSVVLTLRTYTILKRVSMKKVLIQKKLLLGLRNKTY